jgi:putative transposase
MSEFLKTYPDKLYFVTLTVEGWVDALSRNIYKDEIVKNIQYCQQNDGLQLYSYVIMNNHLHMVAGRNEGDLGELPGRFKSYTAKSLLKLIETNPQESRKEWMLNLFKDFAQVRQRNTENGSFAGG